MRRFIQSRSFKPLLALAIALAVAQSQSTSLSAQSACGGFTGGCTGGSCAFDNGESYCQDNGGPNCHSVACDSPSFSCDLTARKVSCGAAS